MKRKKAIGIIPARYASSRFPGKPLAKILGKSLLQRTFENAKLAKALDEVVIATDDARIYEHALQFGAHAVMTSVDCPTGTDRIQEVLQKEQKYADAEIVVNIQGDEPCINPHVIEAIVQCLFDDPSMPMATPIAKLRTHEEAENTSIVKCVKSQLDTALYFSRALIPAGRLGYRQEIEYFRHIGIYAFQKSFLAKYASLPQTPLQLAEDLEQLKVLEWGYPIKVAVVESANIEVNNPEDIKIVEQYLCKQNSSS